jgi:hypothetical protein
MTRVFAGATDKSMPITASLVLLLAMAMAMTHNSWLDGKSG